MVYTYYVSGVIDSICYFYVDDKSKKAFVIDPGANGGELAAEAEKKGLSVEKILLTHGHFDHIGAADYLRKRTGADVFIHENGALFLSDPHYNLSERFGGNMRIPGARYFKEGDVFSLSDEMSLKVIHTPGHTSDSVIFLDKKGGFAFVGDTIFKSSRGNDAFPTGDGALLIRSIKEKIMTLPKETVLLSGHTEPTTVGEEMKYYLF